ncbi:MAG TPA: beta-glucosidase BglX [Candidatus Eisenbergiella merdipullorum]|uniref:beta-glucosidase n=1 Tax=Candidatus Eisenbergiella merdipullorum TaxID=2838553 RepID=A0A9D2I9M4_9FIRM|nr:beta-glucosidase BglX [Candidatus Eisenbergiella merdipullorum]
MKEEKLRELLEALSVTEKIGQLIQVPGNMLNAEGQELGVRDELGIGEELLRNVGSTLNVVGAAQVRRVQEEYLKRSRTKIPLLFMADIIYGFRTVYPIPLALGCSFEPGLLRRLCEATAKESAAAGAHVTFSPMGDLVRDARWGRCLESTGEEPHMNAEYVKAMVEGFQKGLSEEGKGKGIASCVKHFAAYGAAEGGRDYNTVDMSERRLRQDYLPSYKAGVEAGCEMVMTSFNTVDGIPSTGNRWLMQDVLRNEWGFDGVVITDYAAIAELIAHGVAKDQKEAARLAMEAGVDIDMCTGCYANSLEQLIREGMISEEQLDEAVWRVLRLKNRLGLFEDPFRGADEALERELFLKDEFRALAREAAVKSSVLLENKEGLLPLTVKEGENRKKIALIGPYADRKDALGMWAIHGDQKAVVTIREAFEEMPGLDFSWTEGCETLLPEDYADLPSLIERGERTCWDEKKRAEEWDRAMTLSEEADVVILALGEDTIQGGEGGSRTRLTIPGDQRKLLSEVRKRASEVAVVLFAGRPLVLDEVKELADAVLLVWYPGTEGGAAIRDMLFGKSEPQGHLSMSFPRSVGQLPLYYNAFSTGRPYDGKTPNRFFSRYTDCPNTPLYPYGYGLSYHSAEYGPVQLDGSTLKRGGSITARADVTNTGYRDGVETVQLYIQDVTGSVVRPVKELKGVVKLELKAGETKQAEFTITEEMLRFYGKDMRYRAEPGLFRVGIFPDSSGVPEAEFTLE